MSVSKETLRAMAKELGLVELTDEELATVIPELESNLAILAKIRALDLTQTPSARQVCTAKEALKSKLGVSKNGK